MSNNKIIGILCSDIHLSENPPAARSVEKSWLDVARRQLEQVADLSKQYKAPIIIAGDLYDKWNPSPSLINFAIENLPPNVYAIPGQHDLRFHRYKDIDCSAYWTLVKAKAITHLEPGEHPTRIGDKLAIWAFPWEHEIFPCPWPKADDLVKLAVVHQYIWSSKANSYPGAPKENKLTDSFYKRLKGYDAAAFGDNHKGFISYTGQTRVINCGTFFRRKSDEIDYKPMVGLLKEDGFIERYYLDVSKDKFCDADPAIEKESLGDELIEELRKMADGTLDFVEALQRYMDKEETDQSVKDIILEAIERRKK